jgi:predicted alpha/beta superfamily hydrolase
MQEIPIIKPVKLTDFKTKQKKYAMVGKFPTRALLCGPSGSGKGILLSIMILDIYRDCFNRIYIFSPSINVDMTWEPVKQYIEKDMKVQHTDEEPISFSEYEPETLEHIIHMQHDIASHMKKQGHKKLYQILIIIDDFADHEKIANTQSYQISYTLEVVII